MKKQPSETTLKIREMARQIRLREKLTKLREGKAAAIAKYDAKIAALEAEANESGGASDAE